MTEHIALDTNVLIYLHEASNTSKHEKALELMATMPVISSQVVSEYINVLRRLLKIHKEELVSKAIAWLELCQINPVDLSTLQTASKLIKQYDFQYFDAIIVASALQAHCSTLSSKDMQHGLMVDKRLRIINPFV